MADPISIEQKALERGQKFPDVQSTATGKPSSILPLQVVQLDDLATAQLRPPEFFVEKILPEKNLTIMGAHGGIGKTTLALQLAVHVAVGARWAGLSVRRSKVAFLSMEDPQEIVRWRLRMICEASGLPIKDVIQNMLLLDGVEAGGLVEEVREGGTLSLVETPAMIQLRGLVSTIDVLIVDNASDAFDADENTRRLVRAFVRKLAGLVRARGGAVLLLVHVPKENARNGGGRESYSGSTAWHNSARSRLALSEENGLVKLEQQKSNLGPCCQPIFFSRGDHGLLIPAETPIGGSTGPDLTFDDGEVLTAIERSIATSVRIPTAMQGARTGVSVLQEMVSIPGKRIKGALIRLENNGRIVREEIKNKARHRREVWGVARNSNGMEVAEWSTNLNSRRR